MGQGASDPKVSGGSPLAGCHGGGDGRCSRCCRNSTEIDLNSLTAKAPEDTDEAYNEAPLELLKKAPDEIKPSSLETIVEVTSPASESSCQNAGDRHQVQDAVPASMPEAESQPPSAAPASDVIAAEEKAAEDEEEQAAPVATRQPRRVGTMSEKSIAPVKSDPFPSRPPPAAKLSAENWDKIGELFSMIDTDGSNVITRGTAKAFFKGAFASLSVDAMFNEVDTNSSQGITGKEFANFWVQVLKSGYKEAEIMEEVAEMMAGSTWVDFKDGCNTDMKKKRTFPRRPFMCALGRSTWRKCEDLFKNIDSDGSLILDRTKAANYFKGGFSKIASEAMFHEVDVANARVITAEDWMAFWLQVKTSGYTDKQIVEEINNLLDGSPWVDWNDGRTV